MATKKYISKVKEFFESLMLISIILFIMFLIYCFISGFVFVLLFCVLFMFILKFIVNGKDFVESNSGEISINNIGNNSGEINIGNNNNCIYSNGQLIYSSNDNKLEIKITEGEIKSLKTTGNITCNNINGNVECDGNINCKNITGNIECDGNIIATDIKSQNIECDGNIIGRNKRNSK